MFNTFRFNQQNKEVRFGSYVFGPVVMRMYYFLNKPDEALEVSYKHEHGWVTIKLREFLFFLGPNSHFLFCQSASAVSFACVCCHVGQQVLGAEEFLFSVGINTFRRKRHSLLENCHMFPKVLNIYHHDTFFWNCAVPFSPP